MEQRPHSNADDPFVPNRTSFEGHLPGWSRPSIDPTRRRDSFEGHLPGPRPSVDPFASDNVFEGRLPGPGRSNRNRSEPRASMIRLAMELNAAVPYTAEEGRELDRELANERPLSLANGNAKWRRSVAYLLPESHAPSSDEAAYAVKRGKKWYYVAIPK